MDFKNFIELEVGDDIRSLLRNGKYTFAISGQVLYKLGSIVPVIKKDGTFIFMAKITKVTSSLSPNGNIITRVTFDRATINADPSAIREVMVAMYAHQAVQLDDRRGTMPGEMSEDAIRRIASGQPMAYPDQRGASRHNRARPYRNPFDQEVAPMGNSRVYDDDDDDVWGASTLADLTRKMNQR